MIPAHQEAMLREISKCTLCPPCADRGKQLLAAGVEDEGLRASENESWRKQAIKYRLALERIVSGGEDHRARRGEEIEIARTALFGESAPVAYREMPTDQNELLEALAGIATQYCREWCEKKNNYCNAPAEFVLWGKLLKPEALGPRCYDHAASHIGHHGLYPRANFALIDLRPGLAALAASPVASREVEG